MLTPEEIILITLTGTFCILFFSIILFIIYISFQRKKLKYKKEKELLYTQIEIREQIFRNISQEIHDNLGQMLSLVKLNLNTADVSNPATATEKIQHSKELVARVITDLRDISKSLNPELIMQIGVAEAISRELQMLGKSGYQIEFEKDGDAYRLDPQKELILFRIFQEVVNNIIKHSGAGRVTVKVEFDPDLFRLEVRDDGDGFETATPDSAPAGIGISNMKERAKVIGATLALESSKGVGTIVEIRVPRNVQAG